MIDTQNPRMYLPLTSEEPIAEVKSSSNTTAPGCTLAWTVLPEASLLPNTTWITP
jgi:hypothetical protein